MLFRVLGPLAVEPDTGSVVLAGARSRALLTALLLAPGQLVPVHRLAEAVWDAAEPAHVGAAVQSAVSRLRRALGPVGDMIVTRPLGYLLDTNPGSQHGDHRAAALVAPSPS